ncbi:ABC transporter ATP-binding protein [Listeria aquatica]|uniref:ABC transporter-like protein n=1 Tax=Listeria aquatica FSL S10-1188 TaxID=1265818 RepID=W7B2S0_9LIST|nr:ABC transporter ATP-binding protein [Listeria aquatica]EUJ21529.1 ABC transporter-like protein [Listeria aquatica FSL S10-1188]
MNIKVMNLNKYYGNNHALKDVSFDISENGLYLLAGPNGSGKSTLMEIMAKIISADSGSVEYNAAITESEFKKKVGILFQQNGVRKNITVTEELEFVSEIFDKEIDINLYLHKFGLYEHRHKKSQRLSGGLQRKLLIASLFIQDYDIIFFDEPASGLDVQTRDFIWSVIKDYSTEKICIVSDHYLDQAASYCDQILLLSKGNLLFKGSKVSLLETFEYQTRIQSKKADEERISQKLEEFNIHYETVYSGLLVNFYIQKSVDQLDEGFKLEVEDTRNISVEDIYLYLSEKEVKLDA